MKIPLTTRSIPYFLLTFLILLHARCVEKDIIDLDIKDMDNIEKSLIDNEQNIPSPVFEVSSEDVPHVIGTIEELTGSRSLESKNVYFKKGLIDMNSILKVKDKKTKRTNYTFQVYVTGQKEGEFFNMIISEDEKGRTSKPYVRHYVVNPEYLEEYLASGEDFSYFKGTYYTYRFDSFFNAVDLGKGSKTLKGSDCDSDGTTVGPSPGGSVYNPELIQVNGANNWYGPSYFGYLNFPSSSAGTSNTTHNTEAYVNNNEGGTNEYAEVESTYGIVQIRTDSEFIDVDLYRVIATNVTTTKLSGGNFYINNAGQQCSIKITTKIVYIDGNSVLVTEYSGCDDSPMQKTARSLTAASSDCPDGDDGEVAVFNRATVRNIKEKLDLEYYTPEFDWISSNHAEADRLNNFIKANTNTTTGVLDSVAKEFGLIALKALMERYKIDYENEIVILDPSCESFDFYNVGTTGVQVAAVNGIWDVVTKWGKCPGIGVAASYQTYYFHLPSYRNSSLAAEQSADALANAFFDLQSWFRKQPCSQINAGVLAYKMDEFIKESFEDIGGQATRSAPNGWKGVARPYREDYTDSDNCY
ncbi:hypothetical protein [Maribacter sp. MAR_2009_72]|uniref:hypothetical protein n=1 Tax=Maribacter sp. MAR_2009_72 TaxID=1250050 RepID=UPI00119B655C|nr:hypothetical protein [Maribacter sp. MAR_2009_72]TVZ16481.1 hypothetical protein JM81_2742 [Maribacter sp. MAR_2009_72]